MIFNAEKREQLLFPKATAKALEIREDVAYIQGYIDGTLGQYFRCIDITRKLNIPVRVVYELLKQCTNYREARRGVYLSEAEKPLPTQAGLEEEREILREGILSRQARYDFLSLIDERSKARKRKGRYGAVIKKF